MHKPKQSLRYLTAIGAAAALLLCSSCVTVTPDIYASMVAYQPVRSPVEIDASASFDAVDTLSPEMRAVWKTYTGNSDTNITNYLSAVGQTIRNDLATSGLFARTVPNDGTRADFQVNAYCEELRLSDFRVRVTLTAIETTTGKQVSSHTREASCGTSVQNSKFKEVMPVLMADLKTDLARDLTEGTRRQKALAEREEAELLTKASLTDLLVSADKNEPFARARNRAIIAAKNQQLPAILRERKTDELSTLIIKIEQTILDLNHECEIAKDRAQQSVASGETPAQSGRGGRGDASPATNITSVDELRGLAICYRERIELLKPILAALKEEISNRNR